MHHNKGPRINISSKGSYSFMPIIKQGSIYRCLKSPRQVLVNQGLKQKPSTRSNCPCTKAPSTGILSYAHQDLNLERAIFTPYTSSDNKQYYYRAKIVLIFLGHTFLLF